MNIGILPVFAMFVQFSLHVLGVIFLITAIWFMIRSHKQAHVRQQKLDRIIELLESERTRDR